MKHIVHVISDLHLGGMAAYGDNPGFQMCRPETHTLLAGFIDGLPGGTSEVRSHLVIAGDIVDFLAESPYQAFTADLPAACKKLQQIFDSTGAVWDALSRFVAKPDTVLTLMLGNHDIELSLPDVRIKLLDRIGKGSVRFIYDNEAFKLGPLLIEHGNRYDEWNAVPHDDLRRVRSQLSRNLPVKPEFPSLPGSQLVIEVINPLKRDFPFIDLLKPETAAALPIAAALGGVGLPQAWRFFRRFRESQALDYDKTLREPVDSNLIGAADDPDQDLWDAAQDISAGGHGQQISALGDRLRDLGGAASEALKAARIKALFTAFRKLADMRRLHREAFEPGTESEVYLRPAQRAADAGFQVVVYGHTHLPKIISLAPPDDRAAVYINTGTWADVMCVPDGIWDADEQAGRELFSAFVSDLNGMSLSRWRRAMPTYARITIDGDQLGKAELCFADDHAPVTSEGVWNRLSVAP